MARNDILRVVLSVYDVGGSLIKNLIDRVESPGEHKVLWKGENANGDKVPTGVYFFRLTIGERILTTKSTFLH